MGAKQSVDSSLIESSTASEKDVTLGLKIAKLDVFMETIIPEDLEDSLKKDFRKKLKDLKVRIECSDKERDNIKNCKFNTECSIIEDKFYIFFYAFENNDTGKINIAYQFIAGKIKVSKAYTYKTFLGIKYGNNEYKELTEAEKNFYRNNFGVKGDDLTTYLQEEKKKFLKNN